jgi:PhnB protein
MSDTQLSPYLQFNGNCEQAMKFYQSVLAGELQINHFGDYSSAEMPVEESHKDKVMHSTLTSGSLTFMASDGPPGEQLTIGDNVSISIAGTDEAKLTEYFNGLAAGGTVTLPLARQVWGDSFGMLTDKFGVHWMVNISSADAAVAA